MDAARAAEPVSYIDTAGSINSNADRVEELAVAFTVAAAESRDDATGRIQLVNPAVRNHLAAPDAVAAFRAGDADFLEHGPPLIDELLRDGTGHLVASMGEATGPLAFSSCMTTPDILVHGRDFLGRFVCGLARAQRWMCDAGAEGIAEAIAPAFPDIPADIRRRAVERYTRQDTWAPHPAITPEGFEALQEILLAGGFITRRHRFEELVDTSLVEQAIGGR